MASGKKLTKLCVVAIAGAAMTACGGDGGDSAEVAVTDTMTTTVAPAVPIPTDTGAAAITPAPATPGAVPAPGTTPAPGATPAPPAPKGAATPAPSGGGNPAAGQQVFAGAGFCFTCHGPGGVGTALGPNLTDAQWIWFPSKPSEAQLVTQINTGIPQPKQHPAPMPPKGGGQLTDAQVRDVAAYVASISR